jgi:hypothetical protein
MGICRTLTGERVMGHVVDRSGALGPLSARQPRLRTRRLSSVRFVHL